MRLSEVARYRVRVWVMIESRRDKMRRKCDPETAELALSRGRVRVRVRVRVRDRVRRVEG